MKLTDFAFGLRHRLSLPLPGAEAHHQMRAVPDAVARSRYPHTGPPRPGSVLILLNERQGQICFPLIRRTEYGGAHSGQISLPGGKEEPDEAPEQTALRETEEEIGIRSEEIEIIGRLSPLHIIPSNFLVLPVVGMTTQPLSYNIDQREVAHVLDCPLDALFSSEVGQSVQVQAGEHRFMAPAFLIGGQVVWGATAMILNEFRCVIRELGY